MEVVFLVEISELGLAIRQARIRKGLGLEEIAKSLGITVETLRKIEIGETQKISEERLSKIDEILDTSFTHKAYLQLTGIHAVLSDSA